MLIRVFLIILNVSIFIDAKCIRSIVISFKILHLQRSLEEKEQNSIIFFTKNTADEWCTANASY